MHADDLSGPLGGVGELRYRDGRCIAGNDSLRFQDFIQGRKKRLLDIQILDDSLNLILLTSTAKSTSLSLK